MFFVIDHIRSENLDSRNERVRQRHKLEAKVFWNKAIAEVSRKNALIIVSAETKQELKVQSHTLKGKENKKYYELLKETLIESTEVPLRLEYLLRDFSNYVRGKYAGLLVPEGRKTNYLQTADCRIFIHAYLNDAILVTANIKDFFLYPLFFNADEDNILYDISSQQYIKNLHTARKLLESDPKFITLQLKMLKLKNSIG